MVTKIIACGDIHIRNLKRSDEYGDALQRFIDSCRGIVEENGREHTRIVIAGDVFHNKLDISGEAYVIASWLLRNLGNLCRTVVIAGNHDINMANLTRVDPLTTLFSMCGFGPDECIYLDKELEYESGYLIDDNIGWCLYSSFGKFAKPDMIALASESEGIEGFRKVGLFHGEIRSSRTDAGFISENGMEATYFGGIDFGIMGHIHRRQLIIGDEGAPMVYSGSLIQQDHGENVSGHGFVVWDVEKCTYEERNVDNGEYGYYTFRINGIEDIEEGKEKALNL